eukprot:GFUD01001791.1.p1 GENE.GFUD01001791.1~~GFUD01001791.1.p1  ORF type:complete len:624 (-),score=228.51 GFUD01001791.1:20-1891(-)
MAPREPISLGYSTFTHAFKVTDKAVTLPVVSDEVSKFTTPYLEEGTRTIKEKVEESVSETSEIESEMSESVSEFELDQYTSTIHALRSTTPDLVETTEDTASNYGGLSEEYLALVGTTNNYGGLLEEYVASFKIAQLGIRLADSGLAILETPLSLVSDFFSSKVQQGRRHLRFVRRAGAKNTGHPSIERKVTDEEDSEVDPDYVPSAEESQDSLEYRSEIESEYEESQDVDSDMEELEDCPNTVWPTLFCLVGKVIDEEDSEVDPDYVPSAEESQDSLEYRSESEYEESEDVDSDMEDYPTTVWPTLICLVGNLANQIDEDSEMDPDYVPSTDESQDSLEYTTLRSEEYLAMVEATKESEQEELEDCPITLMEKLEDCSNTVWPALSGLVGEVTDEEDSEIDPDYVLSAEESQDSLEYRSETESEHEELEDCPTTFLEKLEDSPNTVWPALSGLVGEVMDEEDNEMDPDYVPSAEESQDSLEYRSESEHEDLEDCPTTIHYVEPNTVWPALSGLVGKVTDEEDSGMDPDYVLSAEESQDSLEYRSGNESEQEKSEDGSSSEESQDEYVEEVEVVVANGSAVEDVLDEEFEEISEAECRTPKCVKDEHEGRRFQQEEVFSGEKE